MPRRRLLPVPPACPPVGSLRWLRGALGWPGGAAGGGGIADRGRKACRRHPQRDRLGRTQKLHRALHPPGRPADGARSAAADRGVPCTAQLPPAAPPARPAPAQGTERAAVGELSSDIQALPRSHVGLFTGKTVGPGVCGLWVSLIPFLFTTRGNCHISPRKIEASAAAHVRENSGDR